MGRASVELTARCETETSRQSPSSSADGELLGSEYRYTGESVANRCPGALSTRHYVIS